MIKYIIPLLLIGSVHAAEIESVSIGTNTLLVQGSGLSNIHRATLARKPVKFLPVSDKSVVLYCKCARWPVGVQRLRLFKPMRKLQVDVTITGQEVSRQPELPPSERPQPAG